MVAEDDDNSNEAATFPTSDSGLTAESIFSLILHAVAFKNGLS